MGLKGFTKTIISGFALVFTLALCGHKVYALSFDAPSLLGEESNKFELPEKTEIKKLSAKNKSLIPELDFESAPGLAYSTASPMLNVRIAPGTETR